MQKQDLWVMGAKYWVDLCRILPPLFIQMAFIRGPDVSSVTPFVDNRHGLKLLEHRSGRNLDLNATSAIVAHLACGPLIFMSHQIATHVVIVAFGLQHIA